jgi:hypothetical protein
VQFCLDYQRPDSQPFRIGFVLRQKINVQDRSCRWIGEDCVCLSDVDALVRRSMQGWLDEAGAPDTVVTRHWSLRSRALPVSFRRVAPALHEWRYCTNPICRDTPTLFCENYAFGETLQARKGVRALQIYLGYLTYPFP